MESHLFLIYNMSSFTEFNVQKTSDSCCQQPAAVFSCSLESQLAHRIASCWGQRVFTENYPVDHLLSSCFKSDQGWKAASPWMCWACSRREINFRSKNVIITSSNVRLGILKWQLKPRQSLRDRMYCKIWVWRKPWPQNSLLSLNWQCTHFWFFLSGDINIFFLFQFWLKCVCESLCWGIYF